MKIKTEENSDVCVNITHYAWSGPAENERKKKTDENRILLLMSYAALAWKFEFKNITNLNLKFTFL